MEKYFCDYDNNFVVLPLISETMLIECLPRKVIVITDESTYVDYISLRDKSTNLGYSYVNDSEEEEYDLPVDNTWIGEFPFWDLPWWQRYDSTTFDNTGKDAEEQRVVKEDREVKEVDRLTTLVFEEIDKSVESALGDKPVGEIVDLEEIRKAKKSKWKPTLV